MGWLLPSDCAIGPNDKLPGIESKEIPGSLTLLKEVTFAKKVNFFAHEIKITAIDEVDKAFHQFLRI